MRFHRLPDLPSAFCFHYRRSARFFAVSLGAAMLAACAGPSVANKSELSGVSQQTENIGHKPPLKVRTAKLEPATSKSGTQASYGVASFYSEDSETASGENFDPRQMTAAHPTLPFGTKLRVTDISTGRSVTVRINDRGPFVSGRDVDLSSSAAEKLGMVERGLTKVKLEIVR
jgi:rare lipoprotein A